MRAHVCPRDAVQLPDRDARAHGVERRLLRAQHQIVDRLLPRREAAVDRERARHVGGVLAPFRRGIDQDQIAVLGAAAVDVVVQRRGVGAAAHDRGISDAVGAIAAEPVLEGRFDLVFVHSRARGTHRGDVPGDADVDGAPQPGDLVGVFHDAHRIDDREHVAHVGTGEGEIGDAGLVTRPGAERHVDRPAARRGESDAPQPVVQGIDRQNVADAGHAHRHAVGAEPQSGPALLRRRARRQEQHGLERVGSARRQQQPGVLGLELGEIEEGVVLAEIVVLNVVLFDVPLVRGRNQDRAASDALEQRATAGGDRRGVHRPPHPRQLGHDAVRSDGRGVGRRAVRLRRQCRDQRADHRE